MSHQIEINLNENEDNKTINLISRNNFQPFNINKKYVKISKFINTLLLQNKNLQEINIWVETDILDYIIEYMNYRKGDCSLINKTNLDFFWYNNFMDKIKEGNLIKLINSADYMNIDCLLHLACKRLVKNIKNKTPSVNIIII